MGESIMNLQIFMATMCVFTSILFLIMLIVTRNSTLNGLPVTKKSLTKFKEDKNKPKNENTKRLTCYKNLFIFICAIAYLVMAYLYLNYYNNNLYFILLLMAILSILFDDFYNKQKFE